MGNNTYARKIYHLCHDHQNPDDFISQIQQELGLPIPSIEPKHLMEALPTHKNKILIVNFQTMGNLLDQVRDLPLVHKSFETIIFNVNKRLTTDELLALGNLKGLFVESDLVRDISKGCAEVINGHNWLPRGIASQLLHYYRFVVDSQTAPATVDLTAREIQILRSLKTGASNMQIADDLFISEFTVKSHLYQIFRKLSVKNRVQAIAWAKQHMIS